MPWIYNYTDEEEEQILRESARAEFNYRAMQSTISETEGEILDELLLMSPNLDAEYVSLLAQSVKDGVMTPGQAEEMIGEIEMMEAQRLLQDQIAEQQAEEGGDKSWWEQAKDAAYDGLKFGSRAGFATLQLTPDILSNLGSRLFAEVQQRKFPQGQFDYINPEEMGSGFWDWDLIMASDFGALFSGEDTGDGFFIGEDAREWVENQTFNYRGGFLIPQYGERTVWDPVREEFVLEQNQRIGYTTKAYSPGRAIAYGVGYEPGAKEWNLLSGAVDSVFQLTAPAAPGSRVVGRGVARGAGELGVARTTAGLTNLMTPFIQRGRATSWLNGNAGRRFVDELISIDNVEDATRLLPNTQVPLVRQIVDTTSPVEMRRLLDENLGIAPGLRSTRDVNWSRWSDVKANVYRNPVARTVGLERSVARRPGKELTLGFANDVEKTETVRNFRDWLILSRVPFEDSVDAAGKVTPGRKTLLNDISQALVDNPADVRAPLLAIEEAMSKALAQQGLPAGLLQDIFRVLDDGIRHKNIYGDITDRSAADLHSLFAKAWLATDEADQKWLAVVPSEDTKFAAMSSEAMRYNVTLPEPAEVIRATSKIRWLTEAGSITRSINRRLNRLGELTPKEQRELEAKWTQNVGRFGFTGGRLGGAGKLRTPLMVLDFVQNSIFKKAVLLAPAYISRILSESQVRQSFAPGLRGGIMHPLEQFLAVSQNPRLGKYLGDLEGNEWRGVEWRPIDEAFGEYIESTRTVLAGEIFDNKLSKMSRQVSAWRTYNKLDEGFRGAFIDNLYLVGTDPLYRWYGKNGPEWIMERLRAGDKDVLKSFKTAQSMLRKTKWKEFMPDGSVGKPLTGNIKFFDNNGNVIEEQVRAWIDLYVAPRYTKYTKGDPVLQEIISNGDSGGRFLDPVTGEERYAWVPLDGSVKVTPRALGDYDEAITRYVNSLPDDFFPETLKGRLGVNVRLPDGRIADPRTRDLFDNMDRALDFFFGSIVGKADSWLNRSPQFRRFYHQSVDMLLDELAPGEARWIIANMGTAYLEKVRLDVEVLSKAQKLSNGRWNVPGRKRLMSNKDYQEALENARKAEARAKKRIDTDGVPFPRGWGNRYVGSKRLMDEIIGKANGSIPSTGTRTLEEISYASKIFALEETRRLLYDVSEASNFAESMQIIAPFYKAWKEGITAWSRLILTNPQETRRLGVTYQGLREGDPDNDGRGFIYEDPISGEPVFGMPAGENTNMFSTIASGVFIGAAKSGLPGAVLGGAGATGYSLAGTPGLSDLPEGVRARLDYNVPSVNMALQSLGPGAGPFVQMAVSKLAPYIPLGRDIEEILAPYGAPDLGVGAVIPASYKRFGEVIASIGSQDGGRIMYGYTADAKTALLGTGQYDTSSADSMVKLDQDAINLGRSLTFWHGLAQWVGPARPQFDLEVRIPDDLDFDRKIVIDDAEFVFDSYVPLRYLAREFRRMQEEDYQNAAINFMNTFGDDLFLITAGKTRSNVGGLSASKEFYEWEQANKDIVRQVPEFYGYFAGDVGTQFDSYAYRKQIESNKRERYDDLQVQQQAAEVVVATQLYTARLRAAGPNPDRAQREALRVYKESLQREFPLWAAQVVPLDEVRKNIETIQRYVTDLESLQDNPTAKAARTYLAARDAAVREANTRRLNEGGSTLFDSPLERSSDADLRGRLRTIGFTLAYTNPDFQALWNEVFLPEVDVLGE